uniref:Protein XRI1 n=1 Tax=Aegilops tauschii TaxID=37682 RepID=M8BQ74_AEGTA
MALQSCHHHDDCRVAPPPLPDWGWEWEWDWEELVRCQLGDAARDGIHGALPGLPSWRRKEGVLYPFAVVKPLVLDGDTLNDVNRRILKRPARPVRHPVGQFACGPAVSSPHGPGLSGKAVVSLTKIRTGGKGTITIIRTRG